MTDEQRAGWVSTTLGEACEINPPKPKMSTLSDEELVLFVPMAAVNDVTGTVAAPEERTLSEVRTKSYRTFRSGDVLFAKITPCMENGKSAIVPAIENDLGFGSTEFHVLRPRPQTSARFIWHLIRQERFRRGAEEHMTGSVGQSRVPATFLQGYSLVMPPLDEQERIADTLDQTVETASRVISNLATAGQSIERFRQSVLAAACSGRLTADWREVRRAMPVLESAVVLPKELPAQLTSSAIPRTWTWTRLKELTASIQYGFTAPSTVAPIGPRMLRITDIQDGRVDWKSVPYCSVPSDAEPRYQLEAGDLVFARTGATTGKSFLLRSQPPRSVFASYLIRVRLKPVLDREYIAWFFESSVYWAQIADSSVGTGQPNVNGTRLAELWVPVPPPFEQHEIVKRVTAMTAAAAAVLGAIETAEQSVEGATQAALSRMTCMVGHGDQEGQSAMVTEASVS